MHEHRVRAWLAAGEGMTVEFKSDRRPLSNEALLQTIVCLANAQGGVLLLGVEDDGTVTGLHPSRSSASQLEAWIANHTVPSLRVRVTFVPLPEGTVAVFEVPKARQPVATSDGRMLIRFQDARGNPGCRPFYPYEFPYLVWPPRLARFHRPTCSRGHLGRPGPAGI